MGAAGKINVFGEYPNGENIRRWYRVIFSPTQMISWWRTEVILAELCICFPPPRYNITGLTQGTKYYIQVSAINSLGYGEPADYQDAIPMTSSDAPSVPTTIAQLIEDESGIYGWGRNSGVPSLTTVS